MSTDILAQAPQIALRIGPGRGVHRARDAVELGRVPDSHDGPLHGIRPELHRSFDTRHRTQRVFQHLLAAEPATCRAREILLPRR